MGISVASSRGGSSSGAATGLSISTDFFESEDKSVSYVSSYKVFFSAFDNWYLLPG